MRSPADISLASLEAQNHHKSFETDPPHPDPLGYWWKVVMLLAFAGRQCWLSLPRIPYRTRSEVAID